MERDMTGEGNPVNAGPGGAERRASPRLPSNLKLYCYPATGGLMERRLVRLRDVSKTGIAFVADRRWEPGTVVVVEVPVSEGTDNVKARVVHATPQIGGLFLMGCVLDIGFTDAQLVRLTAT
jgi:PilZ domain